MPSSIMFIDIETNNHPYYGGVATPYCPDNYVVESAYAIDRTEDDGTVTVNPVYSIRFESREEFVRDTETEHNWFKIPEDCWLIVAFNAAYEISWFLQFQREHFEDFLKRGGRVFCSMQAQYIASDFQELYPSLDETAPLYGGTKKIDAVKLLWQQGVLTKDIDPHLLHDYLVNGDIPNTRLCFYGQCQLFAERGQMPMVWERMESVTALAYCEFNGVYVDMPTARANQKEQEDAIQNLRELLQTFLPELPEGFEFNWNSGYHMSALVYGGMVKYKCKVPYDPPKYVKAEVQDGVYKSGRNKGMPKMIKVDTDEEQLKWGERLYRFDGLVNIQDLPQALREKYGDRGEYKGAQTLADGSPVYSTGTDAMHDLAHYFIGVEQDD